MQAGSDLFQNPFRIFENVMIPEADDMKALLIQEVRSFGVIISEIGGVVLPSIQFNDQFLLGTEKINDIRAYRMLAAKLAGIDIPISQMFPQQLLGVSLGVSQ